MGVSRRSFLGTAAGGSAAVGLAALGVAVPASAVGGVAAVSGPGDVVGKVSVGYQGWFAAVGDGAPINAWWHWSANAGQAPSPSNTGIVAWPDVRDYARTYHTGYASLGNGQPATLFSSYDQQTVDTHFLWLQQNGIDTAALQRFNPTGGEGPTRDAMAVKVRSAAESHGRNFYVMYDVTDWTDMQSEIKADWTNKMQAHTASPAYAVQNGKPVVCVWGFGFSDDKRPWGPGPCLDVVNWFKAQGCYVIGGVPTWWRTGDRDSRAGFLDVYHAFDMISPWLVGRIGSVGDADNFYGVATVPDLADCAAHGIDYQPCVLPGAVTLRQRAHGDFMWRQFYNMVRAGVQGVYISMFDEFNEGNQIAKTAESLAWVPTNSGFSALDEDGTACSSDYYLRLTGDGGRMLKGRIALTATRPTPPVTTTGGGDTTPPSAPGNLQVTGHTSTSVTLSWTAATDNVGVTGYRVLRVTGSSTTPVGSTAGNVTTFTVTGLSPATAYTFDVQALDAAGDISQPSNQVTVTTDAGTPPPATDLALGATATASSSTQNYYATNVNDGNANTYWESANNAFPQWLQLDLGTSYTVKRLVLKLPPATAWAARTQTISVQTATSLPPGAQPSANHTFDPATGNTVTVTLPAAVAARYVRLTFTANTGWPAGQLSELEVYSA
ncbi:discoidin domain-containing protein [Actinacidiphila sp. ITFR-21]|uniref:galactose-binding domain-containing protein n=1 Tax=Actinacidiphila sp. ITFR-21 TaxID=3075199 RepID=UPI0028898285|nr:discoidin domain-containing protein [Streptomyces sp. ITFR-21]WNI15243.1 discoidin domain-containing protein [Streptomyces sp. ITFR-21]